MYHADFVLAGGMLSPTVLGSYTQLIALPTEDEGQDIWQLNRACEKEKRTTSFSDRNNIVCFYFLSIATHFFVKLINDQE